MNSRIAIQIVEGPLQGKPHSLRLCPGLILCQEAVTVSQPAVVNVGRALDCHICLPSDDDQVSRQHFQFEVTGGGVRVRDCGSRNGTFVNGRELGRDAQLEPTPPSHPSRQAAVELADGDCILAGQTVFRVRIGDRMACGGPLNQSASSASHRRCCWPGVGFLSRRARRKHGEGERAKSAPAPQSLPVATPRCQECGNLLPPGSKPRPPAQSLCAACWQEAAHQPAQLFRLLLRAAGLTERHAATP